MDDLYPFAIALGGAFLLFLIHRFSALVRLLYSEIQNIVSKLLVYPVAVPRLYFLGPWSPAQILLWILYCASNVICLSFGSPSIEDIKQRCGSLLLINMVPLYFGLNFNFVAKILGFRLVTLRRIHVSIAVMTWILSLARIVIELRLDPQFSIATSANLRLLIVCLI